MTRAQVEEAIDGLDVAKFRAKYPGLDIEAEFERFKEHFLFKNDSRTGKPNWRKWSDWNRAFHRWCKTSGEWSAERRQAKQPTDPAPELPDLTGYRY